MKKNKLPLIIDTDPGVDDALALMLAFRSGRFDIKALTTVMGNCSVADATSNARTIIDILGVNVPIYSGASVPLRRSFIRGIVMGKNGLEGIPRKKDEPMNGLAVKKIIQLIRQYPGKLTLLAIGPLTNIATALQEDPEVIPLINQIIIMGGATNAIGNANRVAEFNFYTDPEAADVVMQTPLKKVLIPLEVCYQVPLMSAEFKRLKGSSLYGPITGLITPYIAKLAQFEGQSGAIAYDVLAAYYLINPDAFTVTSMDIKVETKGELTRGMTVVERRASETINPNGQVVTKVNTSAFKKDFFEILTSVSI